MATLHPIRKMIVLTPKYVERFRCIGPDCEDNCCTGWTISIDRRTYNAYRKIENPNLQARLQNDIKRTRNKQTAETWGRIELKPGTHQCPMLEDRLCAIQKHLGEDKLSNTCFSYPRNTVRFNGLYEQSLTLSCPEAARLALLAPDAFEFAQTAAYVRPEMDKEITAPHGLTIDSVNAVRMFSLKLMLTQGLELWQKLAVLGVFCEKLDEVIKQGHATSVLELVASFEGMVTQGTVADALDNLAPDYEVQALAFAKLWGLKNQANDRASPQHKVQHAIAIGLGAGPDDSSIDSKLLVSRYTKGVKRLPQALSPAPWLLQNYVLNEIFREFFPFGIGDSVYDNYVRLVTRFGMVRLMMAAQCCDNDALPTVDMLTKTAQVFSRRYQHDSQFAQNVANALRSAGWDSLNRIFRFLKT